MIDRRLFLTLSGGLAAYSIPGPAGAVDPSGLIATLVGKASARGADVERVLAQGGQVQVGELLQTSAESRLSVKFGPRTVINLGPSTKLRIEKYLADAGGEFELVEGSIYYEHPRRFTDAPQKTVVRSPYGLLAVRGTKFFAGPSQDDEFAVFVAEGRVDVIAEGDTVVLHPGFGSGIRRRGSKPSKAAKWPPARVSQALFTTIARRAP